MPSENRGTKRKKRQTSNKHLPGSCNASERAKGKKSRRFCGPLCKRDTKLNRARIDGKGLTGLVPTVYEETRQARPTETEDWDTTS